MPSSHWSLIATFYQAAPAANCRSGSRVVHRTYPGHIFTPHLVGYALPLLWERYYTKLTDPAGRQSIPVIPDR
jgi:hypothetical protein